MFAMNALTVISTDLLTPLGAYLRLRESRRASFLLESVERGRLGRHSFVGSGSRLVDLTEAEQLALTVPVVGYLGYDHAATLEPTVQLPDAGRGQQNDPEERAPPAGPHGPTVPKSSFLAPSISEGSRRSAPTARRRDDALGPRGAAPGRRAQAFYYFPQRLSIRDMKALMAVFQEDGMKGINRSPCRIGRIV